ncbi:MAG TPA: cysteine desulfurase family protein [Candidatus Acidoferrales bacterium]
MKRVYLDNNATTPVAPEVLEAMMPFLTGEYGNAGSIHSAGQRARAAIEKAREQVARLFSARAAEIVFTSGGTESDNLAILGAIGMAEGARKHIVATQIEHSAVLRTCRALEKEGVDVTYVPATSDGVVDPDDIRRALRPETVLISVMFANNELGTVQPLEKIGRIAAEADVLFHTDAVQAAGKIPIDVEKLGVDLAAVSAHKFYGPKGVGALYVRQGVRLKPILFGGEHSRDKRPGTENVAGIVGIGRAAQLVADNLERDAARIAALRDRFEQTILREVPEARVNGANAPRTPNTANVTFAHIEGEAAVIALDLKGMACSTGAACSSGAVEPSHVLTAIGMPPEEARASLRFSLGAPTTGADVDFALSVIPAAIERLRELSPRYKKPVAAT